MNLDWKMFVSLDMIRNKRADLLSVLYNGLSLNVLMVEVVHGPINWKINGTFSDKI